RPRGARRTASFSARPPPGLIVIVVRGIEPELRKPPLRFLHDPPAFGHLGGVVGGPDFVMKQLTAGIPEELLQLRGRIQEAPPAVQLRNPRRQGPQEGGQALRPLRAVSLVVVRHPRDYTLPGVRAGFRFASPCPLHYLAAAVPTAPTQRGAAPNGQATYRHPKSPPDPDEL